VFPEDSLQYYVGEWWTPTKDGKIARGRLLWANTIRPEIIPQELVPEGRGEDSGDHSRARFTLRQLRINESKPTSKGMPVAGMPERPKEKYIAYRTKRRPALVIGPGGPKIPKDLYRGGANEHYAPYHLVAPYYGVDQDGIRGGYNPKFVERVRQCEYPNFVWDKLPIPTDTEESVLRLDHIQPIGTTAATYILTDYCLSKKALRVLDDWQGWLQTELLPEDSAIHEFREGIKDFCGA